MGTSVLVITMAGAGQPWYMPLTWPLGHVATAVTKKEDDKPLKNAAVPYLDITGNFTAMAAAARSWTLAYLCIYYLPQKFGMVYPAFGPAKEFTLDWIVHILARIPHFHLIHRAMHPWKTTSFPDIGKFLYRQVHSLHHKSYNPTAFSGTNMHPVESTLYYSAALIPVAFGLHPVHALGVIVDCAMGAWLGHDGFQWPGSGDYFHMLHHKHFDCNYGAMHVPLDYLFGTYAGSKEEVKTIWQGKEAGEEANDTPVHQASKQAGKVE